MSNLVQFAVFALSLCLSLHYLSGYSLTYRRAPPTLRYKPIRQNPCKGRSGPHVSEEGLCMFYFDCMKAKGTPIGVCMDSIFVGSCCRLDESPAIIDESSNNVDAQLPPLDDSLSDFLEVVRFPPNRNKSQVVVTNSPLSENTANGTTLGGLELTSETITPEDIEIVLAEATTLSEYDGPYTTVDKRQNEPSNETQATTSLTEIYQSTVLPAGTSPHQDPSTHSKTDQEKPAEASTTAASEIESSELEPVSVSEASAPTTERLPSTQTPPQTGLPTWTLNSTEQSGAQASTDKVAPGPSTESSPRPPLSTLGPSTTRRPFSNFLDCGVRPLRPKGRVVGGRNAHFGEWPWQVLIKEATWLGLFVKTKCGGVLIDHKWVLTAAHCQPGFLGSLVAIVGEYDLTGDFENLKPVAKQVKRMIVHRDYNPNTFENDIALLELETGFEVQPHVIPICLPKAEDKNSYVGLVAHVAGWGKLSYGGAVPSILQVVKLPILPNSQCQQMFLTAGHVKAIRDTFVCAGYTDGGKDSCEGDSGGPLMVNKDGRWSLVGTVSHGIKCAEPNLPGVYMRTSTYRPWIDSILGKGTV